MFSEQVIRVKDKNIHYYENGEPHNNTILLLHGGFGDAWLNWAEALPALADSYHLIAPDLPGYGQSDPIAGLNVTALIEWLRDLLDALNIEQAVVVGHSFGGLVGRLFTAQYPRYVPALVLVNGGVIPSVPPFAKLMARLPGLGPLLYTSLSRSTCSRANLESAIHAKGIITEEFMSRVQGNIPGLAKIMRLLTLTPIPENKTPRVAVLMIWGQDDSITPLNAGKSIQRNIPGAKLEEIAECGHMPHLETTEIFVWQIRNFLNVLQRARGTM